MNRKLYAYLMMVVVLSIVSCQSDLPDEIAKVYAEIPEVVDYNFHVKPILSDKCFSCHGPDVEGLKGGFRLDIEDAAKGKIEDSNRRAIVPGKLGRSEVYHRILAEEDQGIMPPPESNLTLSPREKAILIKWIDQGAEYKPHWSFIPPTIPTSLANRDSLAPIDYLVNEVRSSKGLSPNPKADKETLIRRLALDLTGLPPSLSEVETFLQDPSENAYEKWVDYYLAQPSYGERMASIWMDVARYADSDGYLDDKHRDFTPWRDWVIDAYNKNMPYDQFVTWQIAGDLIPNRTKESVLATAFNRLHKKNSEAGIVFEEFRVEYVADRVQTLSQGIMGLSIQCARCHDHKYDEISQKDYYKLFGMFNSTHEVGSPAYGPDQTPGPALLLSSPEEDQLLDDLKNQKRKLATQYQQLSTTDRNDIQHWINNQTERQVIHKIEAQTQSDLVDYYPLDGYQTTRQGDLVLENRAAPQRPGKLTDPVFQDGIKGSAFFVNEFNTLSLGDKVGWFERTEPFSIEFWMYPDTVYAEVGVLYHCEDLRLGLKGYSFFLRENYLQFIMAHSFPQNAIILESQAPLKPQEWHHIVMTYDGSSQANGVTIYHNGKEMAVTPEADNLYKGILYEPDIHTYGFKGITAGNRTHILPMLNGGIDEIKLYDTDLTAIQVKYAYDPDQFSLALKPKDVSDWSDQLASFYQKYMNPDLKDLRTQIAEVRREENTLLNEISEIMVLGDLPEPRPTYVLDRGLYSQPTEEVEPGVPEAIFAYPESFPKNRNGLTQWLFDPEHPLTSRVYVNRLWQMFFGKGLVRTSEDFGNQGELPSHPELLDYLAIRFMEVDWDIKAMIKEIVLSETYQQSSKGRPEVMEKDPENIYFARGPRFRMSAEMIRDQALAASGLLVDKVGGKSTYPYQPDGLWDELSNKSWRYPYLQEPGEGLYRRSMYTIWKRTAPPPSMLIFDVPERSECRVRRQETSTPLQALVLLNDPQYVEACRVMASQLMEDQNNNLETQINQIYRLIVGRKPTAKEHQLMKNYFEQEHDRFLADPVAQKAYLSVGEIPPSPSIDAAYLAALTSVAHATLNTTEAYTRK